MQKRPPRREYFYSEKQALIFERRQGQTALEISARCAYAIRADRRQDHKKYFVTRMLHGRGVETFAIWRLK